jgi:hypothetical protein
MRRRRQQQLVARAGNRRRNGNTDTDTDTDAGSKGHDADTNADANSYRCNPKPDTHPNGHADAIGHRYSDPNADANPGTAGQRQLDSRVLSGLGNGRRPRAYCAGRHDVPERKP